MAPTVKKCRITKNWLALEAQVLVTFSLIKFGMFLQKMAAFWKSGEKLGWFC